MLLGPLVGLEILRKLGIQSIKEEQSGAEVAFSSTGILLGLPCLLCGGITSTKEENYLILESYNTVHEINKPISTGLI